MHTSVGDIHRYLSADEPFGSSHQVPANPAPSWPKGGVRDEGQGWWPGKNLPLATRVVKLAQHLGNVSTLLLVLSEHPLKDGACTLSLGRLAIPYPGYKHHYYAQGHHQSAHTYRHCSVRLFISRETKGVSVKIKVQGEAVALCSGWVSEACDKRDSLPPWPHHSLFLAVREGNTEEQRREDCWAINRFYS